MSSPQSDTQQATKQKDISSPYIYQGTGNRMSRVARFIDENGNAVTRLETIADFDARIVKEIIKENGEKVYSIEGKALRGGPFSLEIQADDFADGRKLKAALSACAGARDPVYAQMQMHLGPAIKLLTADDLPQVHRYSRTGWEGSKFLIPGREESGTELHIHRKLPYQIHADADIDIGLEMLDHLFRAMTPQKGAPILTFAFQAPMARDADWRNERYALFISGRTGSLKTSFAQCVMSIYGNFMRDDLLIKWGEGATRNAIMAMAAYAYDLPLLFDNFKPTTGAGAHDFVNLVHNILEGGEKDRLNRASELREAKPVFCWPLITGEDVPDKDPATLARILISQFSWHRGEANDHLSTVQANAKHLSAVGRAWIDWLESDDGRAAVSVKGAMFPKQRKEWADYLRKACPDMVNILRVASNLASNQLTWEAVCYHPVIGSVFGQYVDQYNDGLESIALAMGERTAESLEATRFLEGLRQLMAIGKAKLALTGGALPPSQETHIGWRETDQSVYLLMDVACEKVKKLLGYESLGYLSNRTLYTQLKALGVIASTGRTTSIVKKIGNHNHRVLHLKPKALEEPDPK